MYSVGEYSEEQNSDGIPRYRQKRPAPTERRSGRKSGGVQAAQSDVACAPVERRQDCKNRICKNKRMDLQVECEHIPIALFAVLRVWNVLSTEKVRK